MHSLDFDNVKSSNGTLSPVENHRIERELVERLYHRDIDRFLKKKGSNVIEEKKFNYQRELRNEFHRNNKDPNSTTNRKLNQVKSKSNLSIENNSSTNRLKNNSNFTFNNLTSGRSLNMNNHNYYIDEENLNNIGKEQTEHKSLYAYKNKQNLIKEQSEFQEQDYADSLRQYK